MNSYENNDADFHYENSGASHEGRSTLIGSSCVQLCSVSTNPF